jgi:hypothetical protein
MKQEIELSGGESVYCINEGQLKKAYDMAMNDPENAKKLRSILNLLEGKFSRNERAALAFILIDRMLRNSLIMDEGEE